MIRRSTLHAVGDPYGNIGTGALTAFAPELIGYDIVNGAYVCRSGWESPEVDGEILVRTNKADEKLIGSYMDVRIESADDYDLTAVQL